MFDSDYWNSFWRRIKKFLRNPFRPDLIEEEGSLYIMDSFGIPSNHHVIAFASTGKSHPIIFTIDDLTGRKRISMSTWDSKSSLSQSTLPSSKRSSYKLVPNVVDIGSDGTIVNVIPMDFNHDGVLDLLLVIKTKESPQSSPIYRNEIWYGFSGGNGNSFKLGTRLPNTISSQIVPIDYYGNLEIGLIAFVSKEPVLLVRQSDGSYSQTKVEISEGCQLSQPSWILLQDLDGDAIPEIIMTCGSVHSFGDGKAPGPVSFLHIWSSKGAGSGYKLVRRQPLPPGLSHLFFADIDGDGRSDMMFLLCDPPGSCSSTNELHFIHNKGTGYDGENNGLQFHDDFEFDMKNPIAHQVVPLDADSIPLDKDPFTNEPVPIRIGDFNLDGHPDLLLTFKDGRVMLLEATLTNPTAAIPQSQIWTFKQVKGDHVKVLNDQSDIIHAAFVDIAGLSTIFLNHHRGNSIVANGIYRDTFFLNAECLQFPYYKRSKTINAISQMPGTTFKIRFTNQSGKKCTRTASQGASYAYMPLSNPKTIFGLGTANNYIEEFLTGINHQHVTKTNIFPNSELIVYAPSHANGHGDHDKGDGKSDATGDWYVELHINPAAYFYYVLASLVTAIIVLGVITAILKWKENKEDEKERRSASNILLGRF